MSPPTKMILCLVLLLIHTVSGQVPISKEVTLTTSEAMIVDTPITFRCNADNLGYESRFTYVSKLEMYRDDDKIAMWDLGVPDFGTPQTTDVDRVPYWINRDYDVMFSDNIQGQNNRALYIDFIIRDTKCADAGVYKCSMTVLDFTVNPQVSESVIGSQNISSRAGVTDLRIVKDPDNSNNQYQQDSNLMLSCKVNGPEGITMRWQESRTDFDNYQNYLYTNDITTMEPEMVPGDACNKMRYESRLNLTKMTALANNRKYRCVVTYNNEEQMSEVEIGVNGGSNNGNTGTATSGGGGDDTGLIVGLVVGLLALIVIVLLLVYFCWYKKKGGSNDKDEEEGDNKPDFHAPPPVIYSTTNKPPKEDRDDGAPPIGMTNIALDVDEDERAPGRYSNAPSPGQEPTNGPPGYATDDDNRRARYNRGYVADDPSSDQGDSRDGRDNYRRRDRGDRRSRGSRSRDQPDKPRSRNHSYDDDATTPPRAQREEEEGTRPGRYSADDGTDDYDPGYGRYGNIPQESYGGGGGGYGDPTLGTAI